MFTVLMVLWSSPHYESSCLCPLIVFFVLKSVFSVCTSHSGGEVASFKLSYAPRYSRALSSQHKAEPNTKAAKTKEIISPSADKRGVPKRLVHPPLLQSLLRWSVPKGPSCAACPLSRLCSESSSTHFRHFMLLILPNSGISIMHGKENGFMANKADWKTDFLRSAYLWTQPMRL